MITRLKAWMIKNTNEKSVINHVFDEYHKIWDLNLSKREDYDRYMKRKGYYVKNEYEESIVYVGPNENHFIIVEKANFEENTKMKIYHTATQTDYDALLFELVKLGAKWSIDGGPCPSWYLHEENTCFFINNNEFSTASLDYAKRLRTDIAITKYRASDAVNKPSEEIHEQKWYKCKHIECIHCDGQMVKMCRVCGELLPKNNYEARESNLMNANEKVNNDGVYTQVDNKVVLVQDKPETGFGQTVINWADGRPVSAETITKHKIK